MRTQVGIIGAGPAGLTLSLMLRLNGIESVIIEKQSREYIEQRVRAGVLEHPTVDLLNSLGVGGRMMEQGMMHHGIKLRFDGEDHLIDFGRLTGRHIMVYGQQEIVKDLIAANLADQGEILFECSNAGVGGIDTAAPFISFDHNGEGYRLECDFIAGCDGFHGICRTAIPAGVLKGFEHEFPFGWLGILAEAAPSSDELIYASHERGFALHSMRSPGVVRNYIQCAREEDIRDWTDDRIWEELQKRMELGRPFHLNEGRIIEKSITPVRGYVAEPMQHGRLFLAGDAAHIVPPTGAKGLNLALKDIRVLADALTRQYRRGDGKNLENYSAACLAHVWRAQYFSWWMTSMLHRFEDHDAYQRRIQLSQLRYVAHSTAAATSLAENYVGFSPPAPG